jgi:hypothetical protein
MRVQEFKDKSELELLQLADDCFAEMDSPQEWQERRTALLLQAQLYMNEVDRRHDARVARRDFRMELIVIGLIALELIVGVLGIVFGIVEGNKQATILNHMDKSTGATAESSGIQASGVLDLAKQQERSLDSLRNMNDNLQASLQKTDQMSIAMRKQLEILREEQARRQAELAKKPKLELYVENVPLNSLGGAHFAAREATSSKLRFDIELRNAGNGTATKGIIRVIVFAKDVKIESGSPFIPVYEQQEDSPQHVILVPFDYIRANGRIPMSVSFSYPTGQLPFTVLFNVDADEIPVGTPLGSMIATPPKS